MAKKKRLELPSEPEIGQLPRWAQVAFAARCARRVQPLFQAGWREAPAEHVQAVLRAISGAELSAAAGAFTATHGVHVAGADAADPFQAAAYAYAAARAAYTAASAARARADTAAEYAALAVQGTAAEGRVIRAMRADFDKLQAAAEKKGWTDQTPVPPEFFGPLWPEGEPPGWPAAIIEEKKRELPSEEEIGKLPRWAQVAFAARCARRVQPLFKAEWPDAPAEQVEAVERAIRAAEESAACAASGTAYVSGAADVCSVASSSVASAAAAAYGAAAYPDDVPASASASDVYAACVSARGAVLGTLEEGRVLRAMRADLDKLKTPAKEEGWTDETPVPPEFFGPLWPEGEPPGWPAAQARSRFYEQPALELYIDPGNASTETIREVLEALSDLHVAAGGLGLEFVDDGHFVYAAERVGR